MLKQITELIRAIAWPLVVAWIVHRFQLQIVEILAAIPNAIRRVKSAETPFGKLEMEAEKNLEIAADKAGELSLPAGRPETYVASGEVTMMGSAPAIMEGNDDRPRRA